MAEMQIYKKKLNKKHLQLWQVDFLLNLQQM